MPGSRGLTVGLAGAAGSGKSTIAHDLAERVGGVVASFGDYVRHLADQLGEPPLRPVLQRIGQERVEDDPAGFVAAFLAWASPLDGVPFVVDGIRHVAIDAALRSWSAATDRDYALVLIDASVAERAQRRHAGDEEAIRLIDSHRVERETVTGLPGVADVVIDGDGPPAAVVARLMAAAPDPLAGWLG